MHGTPHHQHTSAALKPAGGCTSQEQQPEEASPENLLALAREEQADLLAANEMLQRRLRVALDVRNKGRQHGARDFSRLDGADARFRCVSPTRARRHGLSAGCMGAGPVCMNYMMSVHHASSIALLDATTTLLSQ